MAPLLAGGDAREPLREPARDLLVHPGAVVPGALVHRAMGELVRHELGEARAPAVERPPRARRLEVDAPVARPGAEPGIALPPDGALERGVARLDAHGHLGREASPARDARHRLGEGARDVARSRGVVREVLEPEPRAADRDVLCARRAGGHVGAPREHGDRQRERVAHGFPCSVQRAAGARAPVSSRRSGASIVKSRTRATSGAARPKPSTGTGARVWLRVERSSRFP